MKLPESQLRALTLLAASGRPVMSRDDLGSTASGDVGAGAPGPDRQLGTRRGPRHDRLRADRRWCRGLPRTLLQGEVKPS